jgi:tetratricopeptide (TPR) repeat protein
MTLANLGVLLAFAGDLEAGRARLAEARRMFEQIEDGPGLAGVLLNMGNVELRAGDLDAAEELIEQARDRFVAQPNARPQAWADVTLADIAAVRGDAGRAGERLAAAEALFAELGEAPGLAQCRAVAGRLGAEPAASRR